MSYRHVTLISILKHIIFLLLILSVSNLYCLPDSEANCETFFESTVTPVTKERKIYYALSRSGRIFYISPSITNLTGYKPSHYLGKKLNEINLDDSETPNGRFQKIISGELKPNEHIVLTIYGEKIILTSTSKPFFNFNGSPFMYSGTLSANRNGDLWGE